MRSTARDKTHVLWRFYGITKNSTWRHTQATIRLCDEPRIFDDILCTFFACFFAHIFARISYIILPLGFRVWGLGFRDGGFRDGG